ncbi:MAG: hypothetical protein JNM56_27515 [Planctomycetia bacterium]|nr:hypothetical protein [Planctomycetia bacterium]
MIRRPTLLICFAVWLGIGSGLRAEYASVMAAAEAGPHGLTLQADDGSLSGLRFLSPIYLQELQRETLAGSMAALPLLPLDPLTMDDEGAGPPPLIDTPSAAGAVAALLGAFELASDPWVTRFQPLREAIAVERLGGRLFRPPRWPSASRLAAAPLAARAAHAKTDEMRWLIPKFLSRTEES